MDAIRRQVRRARCRLVVERFVQRLLWCVFLALAVAVVAIAVPKLMVLDSLPVSWDLLWIIGACTAAVLAAGVWTFFDRHGELEAAVEIDLRYGLKERVASSMFLSADDTGTRAGLALVEDALQRAERIDIDEHFRVELGRRSWLPLIPAVIAVCLIAFVNDRTQPAKADTANPIDARQLREQIVNSAETLRKKIKKKKQDADAKGLEDAEELLSEIEKGAKDLTKKDAGDRKKAIIKLNDLAQQLEDRRNKLGGEKDIRKQFENLNKIGKGPAEKVADALNKGDVKKAAEEMKKIADKIAKGQLNDKEKKELEKQLGEMKKKIEDAANAQEQAKQDLKKQIEEQKQQGNTQNAAKLQEQLDRLMQNQPRIDQLKDLATKLGQCQQCMKQGDQAGAQQAMDQMAQQLGDMQQQLDEMQMLDEALEQIGEAKQAMGCKQCRGEGCNACQGQGVGKKPGMGMGEGRGIGPRPEEENGVKFRDTPSRQKPGRGRAVVIGTADGANIKGRTSEAIQEAVAAGVREAADPLVGERLPRSRREHAEEYNNLIRERE